jgi:hypothetical protein
MYTRWNSEPYSFPSRVSQLRFGASGLGKKQNVYYLTKANASSNQLLEEHSQGAKPGVRLGGERRNPEASYANTHQNYKVRLRECFSCVLKERFGVGIYLTRVAEGGTFELPDDHLLRGSIRQLKRRKWWNHTTTSETAKSKLLKNSIHFLPKPKAYAINLRVTCKIAQQVT